MGAPACGTPRAPAAVHTYELPLENYERLTAEEQARAGRLALEPPLLVSNARWCCRLRWLVVGALGLFGLASLPPGLLPSIGLQAHRVWPFVAAGVLSVANLGFLAHLRSVAASQSRAGPARNLWAQIVVDLAVLTAVVHYVGSLETYVAFAYLFHVVLACIFFPRSWSLGVTLMASALYVGCVALEESGVVPLAGIYAERGIRLQMESMPGWPVLNVAWAVLTWVVVWYLASHLSGLVRRRDFELATINYRLLEAQRERMGHMLRTTHELKAPFAAIHANVQAVLKGYCGEVSEKARAVLARVSARCVRLADQIHQMVQLANLHSVSTAPPRETTVSLHEVVSECVELARRSASSRGITIEADIRPARAVAAEEHLRMLLENVLANAVQYSHDGGVVRVSCREENGGARVVVRDEGIGIAGEKLPRIFEPFYRTEEAALHSRESTGLGLSIVRRVAELHGVRVRVESAPGHGTTFTMTFPRTRASDGVRVGG